MTDPLSASSEEPQRLQKVLARVGVASRRVCEEMITAGRIEINGTPATLGDKVVSTDQISVDGAIISANCDSVTYLLNKPRGVVSTASDPQGRKTIVELVPAMPRVFSVGRLDMDTEGLILLSNNGDLAHRLTHPSFGIEKEYLAQVQGNPNRATLRQLREGVMLDDGLTSPAKVSVVAAEVISLTIHEGRKRQVRRMCDAVGHPVHRLVRTRIGPLKDPKLKPGSYRELSSQELLELQRAITTR